MPSVDAAKRLNVEINIPGIQMSTCIWAPAGITMRELREALVSQLRLDPSYRQLVLERDGEQQRVSDDQLLEQVLQENSRLALIRE